jgi:hypothetical protein
LKRAKLRWRNELTDAYFNRFVLNREETDVKNKIVQQRNYNSGAVKSTLLNKLNKYTKLNLCKTMALRGGP